MRLLFLALLVCNIAVFAYLANNDESEAPAAGLPDIAGGDLRIFRDRADLLCFRLAPAPRESMAQRLLWELTRRGIDATVVHREAQRPVGYWVYLPPKRSVHAAQAELVRLAERGVQDYAMVVGGADTHAISLGVFPSREAAAARARELADLGFNVRSEPRYHIEQISTIEARVVDGAPPDLDPSHRWERSDCQARSA